MTNPRVETLLKLAAIAVAVVVAAVLGTWGYMSITATPLHPDLDAVPSVAGEAPVTELTDPIARARQLVRSAAAEQNLPGLSVAVGVGSDIVWSEGFGWAELENRAPV